MQRRLVVLLPGKGEDMSLQMILGGSGSGKSRMLFDEIIKKSMENPGTNYIVVVPEQFTMSTQKELVRLHPNHSISNIDVVSFARLAYRIMEETGHINVEVLDEIGKSLILRKVAADKDDELKILKGNMKRIGYISEMKSIISEFAQYEVEVSDIESLIANDELTGALRYKLEDILTIYQGFRAEIKDKCITPDEVLDVLAECIPESKILKDSVVAFDGFTGFTPIQYNVLMKLMAAAKMVLVTVTIDSSFPRGEKILEQELFRLSKTTIRDLEESAKCVGCQVNKEIFVEGNHRLKDNPELSFLEKNIFRYNRAKYNDPVSNIGITGCQNPERELEYIAGEICRLVREEGMRYRDISIITGDVAKYARFAPKILERFGIPYFMDYKRDVMHNPFIECIRAALSAVKDNYSYLSVFRYAKCGMLDINQEDLCLLENFCIGKGIKGHKRWNSVWEYHDEDKKLPEERKYSPEDMDRINVVREQIMEPLEAMYGVFHSKSGAAAKTKALYEFLVKLQAEATLQRLSEEFSKAGDLALEKEYSQIYRIVIDLLDEYVELMGDDEISTEEYMQILDAGFSEARIGVIPPGHDIVVLGDITRTRLGDIKVLFFAGVNDGIIPSSDAGGGIISQSERAHLSVDVNMAPTLREKAYIQRLYLYMNLTKPSEKLYITYSGTDADGSSLRPSYLVNTLTGMFGEENLKVEENPDEEISRIVTPESAYEFLTEHFEEAKCGESTMLWRDLYRWYSQSEDYQSKVEKLKEASDSRYTASKDAIGEEAARKLYGEFLKNSVSRLEMYATCAFAHLMNYGLRLKERDEFQFSSLEMGTVVHDALEKFSKDMAGNGLTWTTLPQDMLDSMASECVEAAADELFEEVLRSSSRNEYMIERMKRLMKRTVWAISRQMKAGSFEQKYAEHQFNYMAGEKDAPENCKIWINGKIDRMDICQKDKDLYVNIIDYKTGTKKFDITEFYHGLDMQLAVYLDAAMRQMEKENPDKNVKPAGVFYYQVQDPMIEGDLDIEDEKRESEIAKNVKLSGLFNSDQNVIKLIDQNIGGSSEVLNAGITQKGELSSTCANNAFSEEEFDELRSYMNSVFSKNAKEIMDGNAKAYPYKLNDKTGCDYCKFKAVCGFDELVPGFKFNELEKMEKDTVMERICGKEEDNA